MRAEVKQDDTVRTIRIEIEPGSVPDLDVTEQWHSKPRVIRPTHAVLTVLNGEQTRIQVTGGLVLKSGVASTQVTEGRQYGKAAHQYEIDQAPKWVRLLWSEAPTNVVSWQEIEVQAL